MKTKASKSGITPKKTPVQLKDLEAKTNPKGGIMERYNQSAKNVIQSMRG
jgi:hypothetical protein